MLTTLGKMGIEPVSGEFSPIVYTEHRILDEPEAGPPEAPRGEVTAIGSAGDNNVPPPPPQVPLPAEDARAKPHDDEPGLVVQPGDTVIVRFDDNRIRRFRLSTHTNQPEDGVVHVNQPVAMALLGSGLEEEVEFEVDGRRRVVLIEKISRPASAVAVTESVRGGGKVGHGAAA